MVCLCWPSTTCELMLCIIMVLHSIRARRNVRRDFWYHMFVALDFSMCTAKPQRFFFRLFVSLCETEYIQSFERLFFSSVCSLSLFLRLLRAILYKNIDFIRRWIYCFGSFSFFVRFMYGRAESIAIVSYILEGIYFIRYCRESHWM